MRCPGSPCWTSLRAERLTAQPSSAPGLQASFLIKKHHLRSALYALFQRILLIRPGNVFSYFHYIREEAEDLKKIEINGSKTSKWLRENPDRIGNKYTSKDINTKFN